jgi:hypothetical protein
VKVINIFIVLILMGLAVSCSTTYGVLYDYDTNANFASLKTYDWLPIPENANIDSLIIERVKSAVNAELQAKGLMMTSNDPDFLITEHLGKIDTVQVTNWDTVTPHIHCTGVLVKLLLMNTKKDRSFLILWMLNRKK